MVDDRTALMSARALSPGYEILWYTIDKVLGQGGFGITYLAHDRNLDRAVAIKEYLPTSFAYRHADQTVKPITSDHGENFSWGLNSFLKEAQTLARFSHPNIVRVQSVFEENSTAYMVMEYEHGQDLSTIYKQSDRLEQPFFEQIFFPIMDGLKEIHKFDFIHRDIKPANIYIREDGTPVLIDFGSARQTTKQQTSEMTALISQGYTPLEQYSPNYGDQGPWTDIYALAATIYEGIVGRKPDESLSRSACLMRSKPDLLAQLDASVYPGCSQRFLNAVFAGLKLEPEGRPQSLEDWRSVYEHCSDVFDPRPAPSGFTALLDSDRTVLQPRHAPPASPMDDFDGFGELEAGGSSSFDDGRSSNFDDGSPSSFDDHSDALADWPSESFEGSFRPAPGSTSRADAGGQRNSPKAHTARPPVDDILNFDDNDLETDSQLRKRKSAGSKSTLNQQKKGAGKQKTGLILAVVLGVLGAGGAYFFYGANSAPAGLTAAALSKMPRPPQPSLISLPAANARAQLDDMANLAPLLAQAHGLNANDPALLNTIRATEASLLSMATKWNATNHTEIANRIRAVSSALPAAVHDQNRIQRILSASGQVSAYGQVLALLDDKRYLQPAGNSVLDKITTVNANDYQKLKSSKQWKQMMSEFSRIALDKLAQSQFDDVGRLTEAALTMDANDPGFNALKRFLSGS
jgi:serine/threonine protein kinase